MGQTGKYWDQLENAFGRGTLTSGYRSQEEQDALVRAGKTKATRSAHTYNDGYDFVPTFAKSEAEVRRRLAAQGFSADKIIYETGKGKNQGTGAHWHTEGLRPMGNPRTQSGAPVNASGPGQGIVNPQAYLDALSSKLAPESKASQNVTQNAATIFGSDQEMSRRAGAVEEQLTRQGQAIDVLSQVTEAAQMQQQASMQQQVEDTRAISAEIVQGTQELKTKIKPIFEARQRIADQLDQLNTMNPLERGIRGIFDLNYDRDYLEGQLNHYDRTLQMRAQDFDYLNNLHKVAMTEIERRYSLDNAMPGLAVEQAKEDLGIVGMRIQQTAGMLGNLRDTIAGESQLIAAKAAAREDLLSRLDGPTTMELANKAKANGGVINFNGVEFSYHELRTRLEQDEHQQLMIRGAQIAAAQGEMNLAESYATNLARSLTREQVEAALANGGVWNGVQLPQDVLTQTYQNHVQRGRLQAETVATTMPAALALKAGSDTLNSMASLYQRAKGLFGNQDAEAARAYLEQGTGAIRQLVQATKDGASPEVITALTQQVAAQSQAFSKSVDEVITRSVGGDKQAAGYVRAFVYGTPMNAGTASEAMTYFAVRGALPQGISISPEARSLFSAAQKLVESNRLDDKGKPRSLKQLQTIVNAELWKTASSTIGATRFERVYSSLPEVARQLKSPFANMAPETWARVRATAARDAAQGLAVQLKTTPEIVTKMAATGKPVDDTPESAALFKAFESASGSYNRLEQLALLEAIDEEAPVAQGKTNSALLLELVNSPALNTFVSNYTTSLGNNSIGDYLLNPIAEGAAELTVNKFARELAESDTDRWRATRETSRQLRRGYAGNPKVRTHVILASIPGVGKAGASALMPHLNPVFESPGMQVAAGLSRGLNSNYLMGDVGVRSTIMTQENAVFEALKRTKFEDPALESYRKAAVSGWEDSATQSAGFMQTLLDAFAPE